MSSRLYWELTPLLLPKEPPLTITNPTPLTSPFADGLSTAHMEELLASAIAPQAIEDRGYQSIRTNSELPPTFRGAQRGLTGLLIPIWNTHGHLSTYQLKSDTPRYDKNGKQIKYETASGGTISLDIPRSTIRTLSDTSTRLWVTEGAKKVDSARSNGIQSVIGVLGVWNWVTDHGHRLPDWRDIALEGRDVVIGFDSDVMTKESVRAALDELARFLSYRGAVVRYCIMPPLDGDRKCGLDDWFASGRTLSELESCILDEIPEPDPEWDPPVPLNRLAGPAFPVGSFPLEIQHYVKAVAEHTQTPVDLASIIAIGTLSAAAGGKFLVQGMDGWTEPVHIHTLAVAGPGMKKSAVFTEITKPIATWEQELRESERYLVDEWSSQRNVLERALQKAEATVLKNPADGTSEDSDLVRRAAVRELTDHDKDRIFLTRVILDDATPEAATSHLIQQRGSVAVMASEGAFLGNIAGRYGDSPNFELLLKGHAGESMTVDRIGREPEHVPRACLTLCLAIQPRVLQDLLKVRGFDDRGGIARLLPGFIPERRGYEDLHPEPVPSQSRQAWTDTIVRLLEVQRTSDETGHPNPITLRLSENATTEFDTFRAEIQLAVRPGGSMNHMQEWASKLAGQALRLAGLLHLATGSSSPQVELSADTMAHGIAAAKYFAAHAVIMYRMRSGQGDHRQAETLLGKIRSLGSRMTRRELDRTVRGTAEYRTSRDIDTPLAVLEEYGYLRQKRVSGKTGRPSVVVEVNPWLFKHDADDRDEDDQGFGSFGSGLPPSGPEEAPAAGNINASQANPAPVTTTA